MIRHEHAFVAMMFGCHAEMDSAADRFDGEINSPYFGDFGSRLFIASVALMHTSNMRGD